MSGAKNDGSSCFNHCCGSRLPNVVLNGNSTCKPHQPVRLTFRVKTQYKKLLVSFELFGLHFELIQPTQLLFPPRSGLFHAGCVLLFALLPSFCLSVGNASAACVPRLDQTVQVFFRRQGSHCKRMVPVKSHNDFSASLRARERSCVIEQEPFWQSENQFLPQVEHIREVL